jgi:hypothetical protein
MKEVKYSKDFNYQFLKINHFYRYSQLRPWIGKHYGHKSIKKFLIIGESHYLPRGSKIQKSRKKWYSSRKALLNDEEIGWTHTAGIINDAEYQYYRESGHRIYLNIESAILQSGFNPKNTISMFMYCAFYNYFQRPAEKIGESIVANDYDKRVAFEVFKEIIHIIKPKYVIFASVLAWKSFWEQNEKEDMKYFQLDKNNEFAYTKNKLIVMTYTSHSSCPSWNKKAMSYRFHAHGRKLTGKERFIKFIKEYKIFSS